MKYCSFLFALLPANLFLGPEASAFPENDLPPHAVPRLEGETVPGLPHVTGRIHVDQFGYLPDAHKVAIISDPQKGYNAMDSYRPGETLEVRRRSDGEAVFRGTPVVWNDGNTHEDSGDRGWWFDFSQVDEEGEYYVYDPSTARRSPVFRIAGDVYYPLLVAAVRTYYYQRLGVPIEEPYAEQPWIFDPWLTQDARARAVWDRTNAATERDLSGGWMDAGDTNKYPTFNVDTAHSLLHTYREHPYLFGDDWGIPESGNGLPDFLDELKFQLDWLVKMQEDDGGVFIKMGDAGGYGSRAWPRSEDNTPRYYGPKCSSSTLAFAGITAHAARVYAGFEVWTEFAEELAERAQRAWRWYRTHPRSDNCDTGVIRAGNADRSLEAQDRMEATVAIHLWALTGDDEFHDVIRRRAPLTRQLSEGTWSVYNWGAAESLIEYTGMEGADGELREKIHGQLRASAFHDYWAPAPERDLYRAWMNTGAYHWGSNTIRASFGTNAMLAAKHVLDDEKDRERMKVRALDMLHSFHGVNPLSMVYLTNMERHGAELSATRIWHERFNYHTPHAANPPPGYVVGGANQNYRGRSRDGEEGTVEWIQEQPRGKAYADFNEPWPMNSWEITENAIYYQAAYIRLLSHFVRVAGSE